MPVRRLLLLLAALLLLGTAAAAVAPREESGSPAADGQRRPPAGSGLVERTISAKPGADATVRVQVGQRLSLEVTSDRIDTVQIEQLDRIDAVEPLTPARFELYADQRGVYPIRLLGDGRRIGRIEIKP